MDAYIHSPEGAGQDACILMTRLAACVADVIPMAVRKRLCSARRAIAIYGGNVERFTAQRDHTMREAKVIGMKLDENNGARTCHGKQNASSATLSRKMNFKPRSSE
jgi:hypothetical protein